MLGSRSVTYSAYDPCEQLFFALTLTGQLWLQLGCIKSVTAFIKYYAMNLKQDCPYWFLKYR